MKTTVLICIPYHLLKEVKRCMEEEKEKRLEREKELAKEFLQNKELDEKLLIE